MLERSAYNQLEHACVRFWRDERLSLTLRHSALMQCFAMVGHWPKSVDISEALSFARRDDVAGFGGNGVFFDKVLAHLSKQQLCVFVKNFIGGDMARDFCELADGKIEKEALKFTKYLSLKIATADLAELKPFFVNLACFELTDSANSDLIRTVFALAAELEIMEYKSPQLPLKDLHD